MTEFKDGKPIIHTRSRAEWRRWLKKNGEAEKSIWLVLYHKNSTTKGLRYEEAVEEALCFGWIDSKTMKRDEESYFVTFTPRKPKSNWSESNRIRVRKLIEKGLMTKQGQALIDIAKEKGTWKP
jgi:uncharacterized protein YdeI (YjbR/CyaY-like superfamily)